MARIALFLLLAIAFLQRVSAQTQDSIVSKRMMEITMIDKIIFTGEVLEEGRDTVVLRSGRGEMLRIPRNRISVMRYFSPQDFIKGKYRFPYPLTSVYLVSLSAAPLRSGEAIYQNHYFFLNSVHIGVTNFLTVSVFGEFISLLGRQKPGIVGVSLRGAVKTGKKTHAGLGVSYTTMDGNLGFINHDQRLLLLHGSFTIGDEESNVSVTAGIPRIERDTYYYSPFRQVKTETRVLYRPFLSFSAVTRIGRRLALMTDNWFLPTWIQYTYRGGGSTVYERYSYNYLLSYGIRYFGRKASLDIGFLNNEEIATSTIIGFPYISFNVKMGR